MVRSATNKGVQTRQRILDVACDLLGRRRVEELTIAEIAQKAGMSKGSVYYYFPDCDAIVREALIGVFEGVVARFERAAAGASSAHDALVRIVDAYVEMLRENSAMLRLALNQTHLVSEHDHGATRDFWDLSERLRELVATQLRRGKAEGAVRPELDADLAGSAIIGVFLAMAANRLGHAGAEEGEDEGEVAADPYAPLGAVLLDFIGFGISATR